MDSRETVDLDQQRRRRKRVVRMRNFLLKGLPTLVITLFILCIALVIVTVFFLRENASLKKQVEELESTLSSYNMQMSQRADTVEEQNAQLEATGDADQEASLPEYGVTAHQRIYLTFDDGPSEYTQTILEVLAEHNVKATFFVVGYDDEESAALYKAIADEGHTLGMHSYAHSYETIYASLDAFAEDYEQISQVLTDATGTKPWLYRFPGGSSNQISGVDMTELADYLAEQGVSYVDWNISAGDSLADDYTTQDLIDNILDSIGDYEDAIILFHDASGKQVTAESLDEILTLLEERDAEILPITKDTVLVQQIAADSDI